MILLHISFKHILIFVISSMGTQNYKNVAELCTINGTQSFWKCGKALNARTPRVSVPFTSGFEPEEGLA
jgi:hypothetical protein